jgi:hypothetical protein
MAAGITRTSASLKNLKQLPINSNQYTSLQRSSVTDSQFPFPHYQLTITGAEDLMQSKTAICTPLKVN